MEAVDIIQEKVSYEKKERFHFKNSLCDLACGIKSWHIWLLLGWLDLKLRYRRSFFGPFWITISMAVMIYSMGFVYSSIFKVEVGGYFLYISTGMLAWVLLSTTLLEMMNCFVDASSFILQVKLPFSIYVLRIITRNFIVMAHNFLAVIPLLIYFKIIPNFAYLFMSFIIIAIAMISIGLLFALIGARFRDVQQVIMSILQVGFLLTPIMWKPEMIPGRLIFALWLNPFYHFVEILRAPLLGIAPSPMALKGSLGITLLGSAIMVLIFARLRHRIPFWV